MNDAKPLCSGISRRERNQNEIGQAQGSAYGLWKAYD